MNEPELQEDDLEERLKTTIRRARVALLLLRLSHKNLLPTVLEDMFFGCQEIIDLYCIADNPSKQDWKWLERS